MAINAFSSFGMSFGMQMGGFGCMSPFGSSSNRMLGMFGGGMLGGMMGGMMGGGPGMLLGGLMGGFFGGAMADHFGQQQPQGNYGQYPPSHGQGWGGPQTGCWQHHPHHPQGPQGPHHPHHGCRCHHGMPGRNMGGSLNQEGAGKPIEYTTSGGYKVSVNHDNVTVTDQQGNKITQSGDPHEYVNGKHIKDWNEKTRTLVLDDGTRITMNATGPTGVVQDTSIYDGSQMIKIDNNKNEVTGRSFDPYQTYYAERNQADGETALISHNQNGGLIYQNIYSQNANLGITPLNKVLYAA